jgi:hypothetical protein
MSCDHLEQETEDGCVQIKVDRGGGGGDSLVWYVPSLRYTSGLGWRIHCGVEVTESSTNKQHIIIINGGCRV